MAEFGELVRLARKKQSWTVQELAQNMKVTPGYISRIEGRGEIPSNDTLLKLTKLLRLNIEKVQQAVEADMLERTEIDLKRRLDDLLVLYRRSE